MSQYDNTGKVSLWSNETYEAGGKQPRLKGSLSMNKMSKRRNYNAKKEGALQSEFEFENISSFPHGQSSNVLPVLDRADLRFDV